MRQAWGKQNLVRLADEAGFAQGTAHNLKA
jgi:hypothetical protein